MYGCVGSPLRLLHFAGGGRRLVWSTGMAAAARQRPGDPCGGRRPTPSHLHVAAGAILMPVSGARGHLSPLQEKLPGSIPEIQPEETHEHPCGREALLMPLLSPSHQPEVQYAATPHRVSSPPRPRAAPTTLRRPLDTESQHQLRRFVKLWRSRVLLRNEM